VAVSRPDEFVVAIDRQDRVDAKREELTTVSLTVSVWDAIAALSHESHEFREILRSPTDSLSLTVARWPAGSTDGQRPHTEDEVYYVVRGRAQLDVEGRSFPAAPGSVLFVARGIRHRFIEIEEDLEVLIFWAPARHTGGDIRER
jgi:mannose-6-phosphate isomerase-like protein (cupin superfamily)